MNTFEAIMSRRTTHVWRAEPVPEGIVEKALEGAHMAPCHRFTWPWNFLRVGKQGRKELFDLALVIKGEGKEKTPSFVEKIRRKVLNPAHLVVVLQARKDNSCEAREDYAAIACAIQNMALIVHSEGYASKWSTGGLTSHAETYRILGVDGGTHEIIGFIWIGVPELEAPPVPKRPPLQDHIRWSA